MRKLTALCLAAALLLNAGVYAAAPAAYAGPDTAPAVSSGLDPVGKSSEKPHESWSKVPLQMKIIKFSGKLTSETPEMHEASIRIAGDEFAAAIFKGEQVPDRVEEFIKTLRNQQDQNFLHGRILDALQKLSSQNSNFINLPNEIPPFLRTFVTDRTADVRAMINAMNLSPHIAEHMKHSIGHYYADKNKPWNEGSVRSFGSKLNNMAKEYRLLDDAVKTNADLTDVKYIVIPDVGATDTAITSRTAELDALFEANPHLTLVVSFADNVTAVGDGFCFDRNANASTLSMHVKKLSFTGKNLQTIGDYFFYGATALVFLTSVDFRGLSALQNVGDYFFSGVGALTSVDFRGLPILQTVGDYFFYGAVSLISVDFRGLSALRSVGNYFFSDAEALISVDFRGLSTLQTVWAFFFPGTLALTSMTVPTKEIADLIRPQYAGDAIIIVKG